VSRKPTPSPSPEAVLEGLMDRAARAGSGEYEVMVGRGRSLAIAAKAGRVDQVRRSEELAASVRLVSQGRLGFAHTSLFTPEALDRTVAQAAAGAELTDPQPGLGLPGPPPGDWPVVETNDPGLDDVSLENKIDRLLEMEAAALEADPRVEKVRSAEYRQGRYAVWLANGHGLAYHHEGTVVSGGLTVKAAEDGEAEMGYESEACRFYDRLDLKAIGREAARRAVAALGGRPGRTGRFPVLLENRIAAQFLDVLSSSFLADAVQKGKSMLAGRIGQTVAAAGISLVDDGLYPAGLATSPADSEGTPRQRTVLIDRGRLAAFLYDFPRARVDGTSSTGNAGRGGVTSPPGVSTTNLYLSPGEIEPGDLTSRIDQGLLVTDVMGLHTADAISGDFSFGVSGFWIQGGRIAHPVKGMALAGNLFTLLEHVAEVGADLRFFGSVGAPSLLIEELTLSGM